MISTSAKNVKNIDCPTCARPMLKYGKDQHKITGYYCKWCDKHVDLHPDFHLINPNLIKKEL